METCGNTYCVADGVFILGIYQMQRNICRFVVGELDFKFIGNKLQSIFTHGIFPGIEELYLSKEAVLKYYSLASALYGKTHMVGKGQIDAGAELAQVLHSPVHDTAAQLHLSGGKACKQVREFLGLLGVLHTEKFFHPAVVYLVSGPDGETQAPAHGYHFPSVLTAAADHIIVYAFNYLHRFAPPAHISRVKIKRPYSRRI